MPTLRRSWIAVGFALLFAVLLVNAAVTYHNTRALVAHQRWVAHTYEVILSLEGLMSSLKDGETGQRGYLITGDPSYLAPYERARSTVQQYLARLQQLTQDNPRHQARLPALSEGVNRRLAQLAENVRRRREEGLEEARAFVLRGHGKQTMDALRAELARMRQEEEELLALRGRTASESYHRALLSGALTTLAALLSLGLVFFVLRREARARESSAQELHRQREWLRTTLASIGDGVLATDRDGRVLFHNEVARELTGWGDDAIGRSADEVLSLRDEASGAPLESPARAVLRDGATTVLGPRTLLLRRDGAAVPIDDSAAPIRDGDGAVTGVVLVFRDVTEQRRAQAALEQARVEAEAANAAKSLFLANMSHELRTPLNAIIGYSEMLQEDAATGEQPGRVQEDLRKINGAGRHLLALLNGVLDLSKIEAGKMDLFIEEVEVDTVVREILDTIRPLAEKNGNRLELQLAGTAGRMRTDLTKLRQSLFNLLSNACKFTRGGTVTLSVAREAGGGGDVLAFAVRDSGIGMSEEQLGRLFQPFSQADPSTTRRYGGTGLGLAISRRFCQLLGGDISVDSTPGEGSTFTVRLPATVAAPAAEVPTPALATRRGPLVLVIDDDGAARDMMRRHLEREGFRAETAATGEEGLRLARTLRPVAITLDVMMPGLDGWAVLSRLKADPELSGIPVVMVSMVDDRNLGYALGVSDYLTKPVDRGRLSQVLGRYRCEHPPCLVLVVEDDEVTRAMMRTALTREGWSVLEAENGRVALSLLTQSPERRPELILLDLMMPEMDGFEFAAALHRDAALRSIPVVVVTAKDLTQEDRRRLNGYVEHVMFKASLDQEALLGRVRDLVTALCRR